MANQTEYDVIVIGAGPTGENLADRAVQGGLTAVIVESELVGGECSYWACMPSKALLRPGAVLAEARGVDGAAQAVVGGPDPDRVLARRNQIVANWHDDGQVEWLDGARIDLVRGHGRLAGVKRVEVATADGTVTLTARHAVAVCTGSSATVPPIDGLADADPWDSRDATSATSVPARLAVIGGGVVGTEMATAYRSLGSEVTLINRGAEILDRLEPFAGAMVRESMVGAGIDVRLNAGTTSVRRDADGVRIALDDGSTVDADEVLVATGRSPRTSDAGVETVGLEPGRPLDVDDTGLVRGVDGGWLYAAGDVNGRVLLTHMGKYQARAYGDAIAVRARGGSVDGGAWSRYASTADHAAVPQVVFTDPEVGAVGHTERSARDAGLTVRAVEYDTGAVSGAHLHADGYTGRAKLVVDTGRNVVVGATFVGAASGELVHSATVAVVGEVPLDRLWHAVPSYPTISEVWLRLLETYGR